MTRIFGALAVAFLGLMILGIVEQGNLWIPFMVILGATIGIPMALAYPFALATKIAMILGLIASAGAIYYGFKNHKSLLGQILAVAGIALWALIGLLGLGTGS